MSRRRVVVTGLGEVCADDQADFWSIYGMLLNAHGITEYVCVGDFSSRQAAVLIVDLLGG